MVNLHFRILLLKGGRCKDQHTSQHWQAFHKIQSEQTIQIMGIEAHSSQSCISKIQPRSCIMHSRDLPIFFRVVWIAKQMTASNVKRSKIETQRAKKSIFHVDVHMWFWWFRSPPAADCAWQVHLVHVVAYVILGQNGALFVASINLTIAVPG